VAAEPVLCAIRALEPIVYDSSGTIRAGQTVDERNGNVPFLSRGSYAEPFPAAVRDRIRHRRSVWPGRQRASRMHSRDSVP